MYFIHLIMTGSYELIRNGRLVRFIIDTSAKKYRYRDEKNLRAVDSAESLRNVYRRYLDMGFTPVR